jgi:membrane-bound metal-dependent hydrolase YbcI (DUF457 family)
MDNITHSLIGVAVANAGLKQKWGPGTLFTLFLASNIPDIDIFWSLYRGAFGYLERRMLTHSIFGLPVLVALLAFFLRKLYPALNYRKIFGLGILGAGLHVFFDMLNSYGVVVFYPASRARLEFSCVFIIDLIMLGILVFPFLLFWIKTRWTTLQNLSRASVGLLTAYLLFCFWARASTMNELDRIAHKENLAPSFSYAFPEALGPHRFRGVLKLEGEYRMYLVNVLKPAGSAERVASRAYYRTDDKSPEVGRLRTLLPVQRLLWFAKAPVWQEVRAETPEAPALYELFDLRFVSTVLDWRRPMSYQFEAPRAPPAEK